MGQDIDHVLNARAALSLGMDMTFRDYAQATHARARTHTHTHARTHKQTHT